MSLLNFFFHCMWAWFLLFFYKTIKTWGVNKWINEIWTQLHFLILPLMSSVCDVARRSDDIIVLKPILKKQKKLPTLFLLPRPNLLRANRVVFFCQQSFLKEIFFQRNLFLFNFCMVVWGNALPLSSPLSLFLPPLVSVSSVESSRCSFKLTLTSRGCFLFDLVFLCFTFCKLNESKQKIHTKRTL